MRGNISFMSDIQKFVQGACTRCYHLMKLGIGSELQRVALDPKHPHRLASAAEILALMPELKPPG